MEVRYVKPGIIFEPMPNEEATRLLEGQLQQRVLTDPQQHGLILEHRRALERESYKSQLRKEEQTQKQKLRQITVNIWEEEAQTVLERRNGDNQVLKMVPIFSCQVLSIRRFQRELSGERFLQIEVKSGGGTVASELYPEEILKSASRLRHTFLGNFDCSILVNESALAWEWMRRKLIYLYEKEQEIRLPELAGWFQMGDRWHFWIREDKTDFLASEVIKRFARNDSEGLEGADLARKLLQTKDGFETKEIFGILIIFRFYTLLARFIECEIMPPTVTFIGEYSLEIAKAFLCTMRGVDGEFDIINLDADRISVIRKRVTELQDTPAIFVSLNPDNRSTKNRIQKVKSWLETGCMEENRISVPFIFCLRECSPQYDLDAGIVVMAESVKEWGSAHVLGELQHFVIKTIETSGSYWVDTLRKESRQMIDENPLPINFLSFGRVIEKTIFRMLGPDEETERGLREIFEMGLKEMKRQITLRTGVLPEMFRAKVAELCDEGRLIVRNKSEKVEKNIWNVIYYDEDYYFFPRKTLEFLRAIPEFGQKALLEVKRELAAQGLLKQYRKTGIRPPEYEIDIVVGKSSKGEKLSVFAIKRIFWDEIGGIALRERGRGDATPL